jgi:hypothetical protein
MEGKNKIFDNLGATCGLRKQSEIAVSSQTGQLSPIETRRL